MPRPTHGPRRSLAAAWSSATADGRRAADAVAALLVLLFLGITLGPALVGHGVLLDTGILTSFFPWRADGVALGSNFCRGDTVDAVMPQIAQLRRGFFAGDLVTWSPYTAGGTPLGALPSSSVMSPVMWPHFFLPFWLAPAFVKLAQFAVAIVGMIAFLGRLGVSRAAAALAGVAFVSCGFMMMWSNWQHTAVGCFIPLMFWAVDRAVVERRPRDAVAVAVVLACMILGGFPAVTMYTLTLAAVYALVRGVQQRSRGGWAAVGGAAVTSAGGVVLGVALSAFQLMPFLRDLESLNLEGRSAGGARPVGQFVTAFAPEIHGTCHDGVYHGPLNPIEGIGFVGAATIVLVLCAVLVRLRDAGAPRRPILLAVMCAVVVEMLWIGGPLLDALQVLPGYNANPIGRATSVFGFLAAALAGVGLDRLFRRATTDAKPALSRRHLLVSAAVVAAVLALTAWALVATYRDETTDLELFRRGLVVPAVVLAAALVGVATTFVARRRWRLVGPALVACAMAGQASMFAHQVMPAGEKEDFYPTTEAHRFLQDSLGSDRYVGADGWSWGPVSAYYEIRTPFGHAFHDPRWFDLLTEISPDARSTPTFSALPSSVGDLGNLPILDQLGVRYYATGPYGVHGQAVPSRPRGPGTPLRLAPKQRATCAIPGGPLRGVALTLRRELRIPPGRTAFAHARVTTPDGTVLNGTRALHTPLGAGPLRIALPGGESLTAGAASSYEVEVWFTHRRRPVVLKATDAGPVCAPVRPDPADRLRLAHADGGSVIYERTTALPRIRWASRSEVVTDPDERVERLGRGLPEETVLLESDDLPTAAGRPAGIEVVRDDPEQIEVEVDAEGDGYLVVADSIVRDGWSARVDGTVVDLEHGNHAFAAIHVPEGRHTVKLTYTAPGLRTGIQVSAVAAAASVVLLAVPPVVALRRRRRDPSGVST